MNRKSRRANTEKSESDKNSRTKNQTLRGNKMQEKDASPDTLVDSSTANSDVEKKLAKRNLVKRGNKKEVPLVKSTANESEIISVATDSKNKAKRGKAIKSITVNTAVSGISTNIKSKRPPQEKAKAANKVKSNPIQELSEVENKNSANDNENESRVPSESKRQGKNTGLDKVTPTIQQRSEGGDEGEEITKKPVKRKVIAPNEKQVSNAKNKKLEDTAPKSKPPNRSILQLKVMLRDIKPPIWRRIQVLNNDTFFDLKDHINTAVGWSPNRSYQFISHNQKTDSNVMIVNGNLDIYNFVKQRNLFKAQTTKLSKYLMAKGDTILYECDFGDSWIHEVVVEKVLPPPPPKAEYPKCTGGQRACPPEDCGGVDGYMHLLEVIKDPKHKEYEELIVDWLGDNCPGFDPEKFDKKQVFRRVWMWVQT